MNSITRIELPATSKELLAQCETIRPRTLYFGVWDIHFRLYDNPKYKQYLIAYTRDQAVEGSIPVDETMAAIMIREEAEKQNNLTVQGATLNNIIKQLRRVMKDSNISRKARRELAEALAAAETAEVTVGGDDGA